MRPGTAAVLRGLTGVEATVLADRATTTLPRLARGGRVAGRLGRTGAVGGNRRGAMVTRRMKVRDRLSDDGGEGLRRGEERRAERKQATGEFGWFGILFLLVLYG